MIAVGSSAEIDLEQKLQLLFPCTDDQDVDLRAAAMTQLGIINDPRVVAKLREFMNDEDPIVQGRAMLSLAALGDRSIVDKCFSLISHGPPLEKESAIRLLDMLNLDSLVPLLEQIVCASEDIEVRMTAATLLARRGISTGRDLLKTELPNAHGTRRLEMACALARLDDQLGIDVLKAMLQPGGDSELGVGAVQEAIRGMMENFGVDPSRWSSSG
jgi:HEAT repeat protein